MPRTFSPPLWLTVRIAQHRFQSLNLDHPWVAARVVDDIDARTKVYYDQRWHVTDHFCRFLLAEPAWVASRSVLVLGAGVGLETLIIGSLCKRLYVNDLSPVALELCALQLRQNGITDFVCLCGRYETLDLPAVDLIAGCFLVYNSVTASAMRRFLERQTPPVLLMNDNMLRFQKLMRTTSRSVQTLVSPENAPCLLCTWEHMASLPQNSAP